MLGPHLDDTVSKPIVQDETLHCKVMVMSCSHLINSPFQINEHSLWGIILIGKYSFHHFLFKKLMPSKIVIMI